MERRRNAHESLNLAREVRLAIESILRESLEERNRRIQALEDEIRALRNIVSTIQMDSRFWVGLPIGFCDDTRPYRKIKEPQQKAGSS